MLKTVYRLFVVFLLSIWPNIALCDQTQSNRTTVIKAGMVTGFTTYTTWPVAIKSRPFVIGVIGDDEYFITALTRFFSKKPLSGGRQLKIQQINPTQATNCQVVIILGEAANQNAKAIIAAISHLPILTISDQINFAASGGHVNFFNENNKLRFEINWHSTIQSNLKISSQLLRLARVVGKKQ